MKYLAENDLKKRTGRYSLINPNKNAIDTRALPINTPGIARKEKYISSDPNNTKPLSHFSSRSQKIPTSLPYSSDSVP